MTRWRRMALSLCALALAGCLPAARYHASPMDALTEAPGRLAGLNAAQMATVQVRAEVTAAGGELLLYNWQPPDGEELALTLVAPVDDGGWRAQASATVALGPARDFIAAWAGLGDAAAEAANSPVVAVYGWSDDPDAETVDVVWSDGAYSRAEVIGRVFLAARPAADGLQPITMTLVAADGRALAAWPGGG